ncbi:hypothetical protein HOK68_02090 [Candidatus Woesearchaeota archaeon]|jgi:hypothetical protein|nr:hypothetical protein [Candidatus Woesearchaeota archaeon]MBT4387902.1 hypothetical protein [Candidatus Woesearchaeota archaeon]MBT4595720.1 hypothetical protein [Candidatus Woesearchaeota archaeon]MBT5741431.1 hypothetical protein [Candidatus Woesearchaeota archaeon]MBT6505545.1 hypothetical protein [Candidatus Woesearchaeota archaeon]
MKLFEDIINIGNTSSGAVLSEVYLDEFSDYRVSFYEIQKPVSFQCIEDLLKSIKQESFFIGLSLESDCEKNSYFSFSKYNLENGNFKEIIRLLNTNDLNLNYFSTRLHFSRTCDILPVDKIENNNKCFASFYLMKTKTGVSIYKGIIPKDQFSLFGLEKDVSDFIICEFKPESHYCMVYFDN